MTAGRHAVAGTGRIGSLFTGYGGLDMAVEQVTGAETVWFSEVDSGCNKVLDAHWPGVPNIGDITKVDWANVQPIDILCGGFPCQDVSAAGKRAGLVRYGTPNRSGLWAEMARAIDILRPSLVIAENVRGLLSAKTDSIAHLFDCSACLADDQAQPMRALGAVLGDLAGLGYDAAWQTIAASDIGAGHERYRVFIIASPISDTIGERFSFGGAARFITALAGTTGDSVAIESVKLIPTPSVSDATGGHVNRSGARSNELLLNGWSREHATDWGEYRQTIEQWERLTRPAPAPTEIGPRGGRRLAAPFVEWLMGLNDGHVTDSSIGLSRNEALKALGNGVVPQQAVYALSGLLGSIAGVL